LGRGPYDLGWWTTGLYGALGACAAACSALRLDAQQTASALGIAAAGSGGMKAIFGTDAKAMLVGQTAEAGVRAALLARAGGTGPVHALEGESGIAALVNGGAFHPEAVNRLGTHWNLLSPGIDVKRIPVCLSSHAAVDALRELVDEGLDPAQVERVVCDVPAIIVRNLKYAEPVTPQQAQFSLQFSIAATLLLGDVSLSTLTAEVVNRPDMIHAMRTVSMTTSARWDAPAMATQAPEGAHIRVFLRDGRTLERYRSMANGSTQYPLSTQAIGQKFLVCAARAMSDEQAGRALAALTALADQTDARALFN
jgi:2-methylcitrate dehydratase PrpD